MNNRVDRSASPAVALRLSGVSRDYRQGTQTVHALRTTDLEVCGGELVGILGPSGSGKSTLLTVMGGLRTPTTGTVEIDGEPLSTLPEKKRTQLRHRRLGFVLQSSGLVPFLTLADQFALHDRVLRRTPATGRRDDLLEALGIAVVTHDERILAVCDRVMVMQDGVLSEQAHPESP